MQDFDKVIGLRSLGGSQGMVWTREKPTVEGHYWARIVEPSGILPLGIRRVDPGEWGNPLAGTWYEFAGPIPEPTPKDTEGGK